MEESTLDPCEKLYVHGVGHFHPPNVIDNAFLDALDIGSDEGWIMERVGIRSRRTILSLDYIRATKNSQPLDSSAASLFTNAQTGAKAATMAMERAGVTPSQIGLVIAGGCSPQYLIPAEACLIAEELGIMAPAFDINSACSSFAAQLHHLRNLHTEATPDYILVVNSENNTRTIDYSDRRNAVLWGDASTAAIVSRKKPARLRVNFSMLESDPTGCRTVKIEAGRHFSQNGSAVQTFAIRKSLATVQQLRSHVRGPQEQIYFIGHQANLLMLENVIQRAEIQPERHLFNVDEYGNCGAAGAPSVLSMNWDKFKTGDEIAIVVVGSGLTWGGLLLAMES
jgi:3-oxoacyl-[acyl-carrier-protein] synthase-3